MLETLNSPAATLFPAVTLFDDTSGREFIISRLFDAPRELVFESAPSVLFALTAAEMSVQK
jgi:hypothetical protein